MKPAATALLTVALLLGSSGCAGSLFKSKIAPPTVYLLSAGAASPADSSVAPAIAELAVLKPRVNTGLDSDRIAALYPDRRLDYFADARWSGPLDEVLQDLAIQVFHSLPGLRNVSGDASAFASVYWLEIDVTDFEAEYARSGGAGRDPGGTAPPAVHVHLLARLGGAGERRIIGRYEADARQPATDNRLGAIVDAYGRAANQALMQIAAGCATSLAQRAGAQ